MKIKISEGNKRLDKFLSERLQRSRSFIQKLIEQGRVLVGDKYTSSGYILREKDVVNVSLPEKEEDLKKEEGQIPVIFEDEDIIVIDKPAGILVHPLEGKRSGAIVNILIDKLHYKENDLRPGVVHRLDKDTTGLLVLAKNKESFESLKSQFQERKIEKRYLVLVYGHLEPKHGEISIPIARDVIKRTKRRSDMAGKEAVTGYDVLEYISHENLSFTLIEADLRTGRTHQIRVHFSSIGFPVVGDEEYTTKLHDKLNKKLGVERQFLHAYKLGFLHPKTGKWTSFKSDLPPDLSRILNELRG